MSHAARRGIKAQELSARRLKGRQLVLVASYGDEIRAERRPVVLLEHGAGQHYSNAHSSYAGGGGRESVELFLCPNEQVAERNRAVYPNAKIQVVGSPKLDRWMSAPRTLRSPPIVAISFHWQCTASHESQTAWPHYRDALGVLAQRHEVLGHGHPRTIKTLEPFYRRNGIEVVSDFEEILDRADVYVIDNSSTGIEAMAAGIPVVWMNSPAYRREVHHGGRFWTWTEGIPTVDGPDELPAAIDLALANDLEHQRRREALVQEVYTFTDGQSSKRAAEAIRQLAMS